MGLLLHQQLLTAGRGLRAAGAFDEAFDGWGGEDLSLGYRLFCHGLGYQVVPGAWGIEAPVERDMVTRMGEFRRNMRRFVDKYPEPRIEIGWATVEHYDLLQWEAIYAEFVEWREQVRGLSVADEIDEVMRRVPAGDRVAILGAGGSVPASARNAVLLDFDADPVGGAGDGGPDSGATPSGCGPPWPTGASTPSSSPHGSPACAAGGMTPCWRRRTASATPSSPPPPLRRYT